MEIKRLTATFGRLENETLSLAPGLNVIQAPNEGGKSTWTAFLRVMLYGLNTRDRSPGADKRRYLPWSGSSMQGLMEADTLLGPLVITRSTTRANAPMGAFSALRPNTTQTVGELTSTSCGETLLGVPQDVYERSAYIRQAGLFLDQSAALERRIAALITTGEEETSYTDAADLLRRQLNRRRANRTTGLLPQLEQQEDSLRRTLEESRAQREQLAQWQDLCQQLSERQEEYLRLLSLHDQADQAEAFTRIQSAQAQLDRAQAQAGEARQRTASLPSRQELTALSGAFSALDAVEQNARAAQEQVHRAAQAVSQAEEALVSCPMTWPPELPEGASLDTAPRPRLSPLLLTLAALLALGLGLILSPLGALPALGGAAALAAGLTIPLLLSCRRRQAAWEDRQQELHRQRQQELAQYTILYESLQTARAQWQAAQTARDRSAAICADSSAQILAAVRRFSSASDIPAARQAVAQALSARDDLDRALLALEEARLRRDVLPAVLPSAPPVSRPAQSRQQLQALLQDDQLRISQLERQIHTAQGQLQATGDPLLLQSSLEQLRGQRQRLQEEYDAIALAMSVLEQANTTLQTRFSPALGEKSAEIFTKLTGGKYNKVLLDRAMLPSALEAGQILPREASVLSQGTGDQLYLAVRLAICAMVLPPENAVPILLDDALVTFDDQRMSAALDYLVQLGQERQILLFTCQSRELTYLEQALPGQFHAIRL